MTTFELEKLRFPIGHFVKPENYTSEILANYIQILSEFPNKLKKEVSHLTDEQLNTEYRPQGWTIRQVIHHCADSHINSFTRFKLALTEDKPIIKPYFEDKWAEGLHIRWIALLNSLTPEELERKFIHPEHGNEITLKENIGVYAWHCEHHLAHITELKKRKNWR